MNAVEDRPVLFAPTRKQSEFLAAGEFEVAFGSSLGCGKSVALIIGAVSAGWGNKAARSIVFRKSFPEARDLVLNAHEIYGGLGARFNAQTTTWVFNSGQRVEISFCEGPSDLQRYAGREFSSVVAWDELQSWADPYCYLFMMSRIRTTRGTDLRPQVLSSLTASGPGLHWIKERFQISDEGWPSLIRDKETGLTRRFVPAKLSDNPHLNREDYERRLRYLSPASRRALIEGRFDAIEGSIFGDAWRREINGKPWHVCEPFEIPVDWDLWRGADDGFVSHFACYWLTRDPDCGTYYVIDEIYATRLMADEIAERVKEKDLSIKLTDQRGGHCLNKRILRGMLDSAAFAQTGQAVITRGDQMNAAGCKWIPVEKFPGSRIARIKNFHQLLAPNPKGPPWKPGIVFFSTCRHAIRTIPTLQSSQRDLEDIDDSGELHALDGVTYGLQYKKVSAHMIRLGGL